MNHAVLAEGLVKRFGETTALAGVDLAVRTGTVLGLLGPNGAGKTTAVRILATLLRPDAGRAQVGGYDVVRQAHQVRQLIGLTGQYASVDEMLTGTENLRADRPAARPCRGPRPRRRAARAAGAVRPGRRRATGRPRPTPAACGAGSTWPPAWSAGRAVLFLDEPTTGLDPRSRHRAVGDRPRPGRRRRDRAAHHAVPRGGRPARRRDRGHRPRPGHRHRHAGRAQGPHRRAAAGGAPGRRGRPADRRGRSCATWPRAEPGRRGVDWSPRRSPTRRCCRRSCAASTTRGVLVAELALRNSSLDEVFLALTGHRAERRRRRTRHGRSPGMTAVDRPAPGRSHRASARSRACAQTATLAWRTLVQIKHNPLELLDFSIQPIMFLLLFTYVFGGAIAGSHRRLPARSRCPASSCRTRCSPR